MELTVPRLVRQAFSQLNKNYHSNLSKAPVGLLEPHSRANSLHLPPELAWSAATEALPASHRSQLPAPTGWALWLENLPGTGWPIHALGEFPQRLVIDALLQAPWLPETVGAAGTSLPVVAGNAPAQRLLRGALLRQAGRLPEAAEQLAEPVPADWQACQINEQAALAWYQGDLPGAERLWLQAGPQAGALYNLGLVSQAKGDSTQARSFFAAAADAWPESSAWHHTALVCQLLA